MKQKSFAVVTRQDIRARRSFRVEAPDQYAAKYLVLFLMDRGIYFLFLGFFRGACLPEICFSVPKNQAPEIESFLASLPTARPASTERLTPHLSADAEAGRLDLAESRHILAQVNGCEETEYLADLWNAFAPRSQAEAVVLTPTHVSVP